MILNKEQASSILRCVEVLEETSTKWAHLLHGGYPIHRNPLGEITIESKDGRTPPELYESCSVFKTAYGLK